MNDQSSFKISQDYIISPPKSTEAFPMAHDEWDYLKEKLNSISRNPGLVSHSFGISFLMLAFGNLYALIVQHSSFTLETFTSNKFIVCAAISIILTVVGVFLLVFAHFKRKVHFDKTADLIKQMDLIQNRYARPQDM